jgi:phenylpropionate dioxygenase-like ring-hydroxylating dioxygenase large terminal subunit
VTPRAPLPVVLDGGAAQGRDRPKAALALEAEADRARAGALTRYWYVACLSDELPRDRPLARTVFGVPLVLFRAAGGAPAALFDRCLHRNAALSAGVVIGGRLACAYHGWTYDGAGRCVEIPSLGPSQRGAAAARAAGPDPIVACPADAGAVEHWPTLEQDGLVFVHPGGGAASARRPAFRTPHWGEPGWSVYYMVTRFPNGVTNLVENFMDVPHTAFVHEGWFRNRGGRRVPTSVRSVDESVLVTYEEGDRLTGVGRLFNPSGAPSEHTDKFYAPHVTRVDYRFGDAISYVITSQVTPVAPLDSLVYTAISYKLPFGAAGALAARAVRPLMRWYTTRVIRQDVDIMEVQRRGLSHAPGGGAFIGTDADEIHVAIESWRRWLLAGAPDADRPPASERRIEMFV